MARAKKTHFAGPLLGVVLSLAVGLVVKYFATWFDQLSPNDLFLIVFGSVAVIWFATERFYHWEYSREYVSEKHLADLQAIARNILDVIDKKQTTLTTTMGKDCDALLSHDHKIRKECKWWDEQAFAWSQTRWKYQTELATSIDENELNNWPFNRNGILGLIEGLCRLREESRARGASIPSQQWTWSEGQITTPVGRKNTLIAGDEGGSIFIYDVDDPGLEIDVEESKRRLISIFENADGSPELHEWVERELSLSHDKRVASLKDLLHDFTLLDRLRVGHGCKRCNS